MAYGMINSALMMHLLVLFSFATIAIAAAAKLHRSIYMHEVAFILIHCICRGKSL